MLPRRRRIGRADHSSTMGAPLWRSVGVWGAGAGLPIDDEAVRAGRSTRLARARGLDAGIEGAAAAVGVAGAVRRARSAALRPSASVAAAPSPATAGA